MQHIFKEIKEERKRQDIKWGADRNLDYTFWHTILAEETGEAAKAVLKGTPNLRAELIQVIAVAVAWIKNIERQESCDFGCGYEKPYGFVTEAGCPVHDKE